MFNTLFSRMLATYLSVMLAILLLLGITVAGMFQNQYIAEQESFGGKRKRLRLQLSPSIWMMISAPLQRRNSLRLPGNMMHFCSSFLWIKHLATYACTTKHPQNGCLLRKNT